MEIITWRQLGLHDKPILVCDVAGSAAPLLAAIEASISFGFAPVETRRLDENRLGVPAVLRRLAELPGGEAARPERL